MSNLHDPDSLLDYGWNWAGDPADGGPWLESGETLATSTWIVPAGIEKVSESHTTTVATVWLTGGTDGATYRCTNRITTTAGRRDDRTLIIRVRQR